MYDRQLVKGCPVNDLPAELLTHIFYLGTRDHAFLVLASHVCRLWRCIAVGSPSLWTTITFSNHSSYKRSQVWIERSKSLPIEIEIKVCGRNRDIPVQLSHISTILDIIVPHVTRWRKLEVTVNQDVYMDNLLTRLAQCASAPLLEILVLHFNPGRPKPKSSLILFHGNAPRLSYVTLENVSVGWSSSLFHDLVKFRLVGQTKDAWPSWIEFSRILRDSPRLTFLDLVHSGLAESFADWQDGPIELPSLENLSLENDDPIYISSLFRLLSMPNLKELSLDLSGADCSEFVRQLATPRQSALSGLQHLKLTYIRAFALAGDPRTIRAIYRQLTNLESIYIDSMFVHRSFFTMLMTESFSGVLYCPNLTKIITTGVPWQNMRSLITVRAKAGIPIKQVVMNEDDALNEEDERWLRENVQSFERFDDGYNIEVPVRLED